MIGRPRPKKRTATIVVVRARIGGRSAAREMRYPAVVISAIAEDDGERGQQDGHDEPPGGDVRQREQASQRWPSCRLLRRLDDADRRSSRTTRSACAASSGRWAITQQRAPCAESLDRIADRRGARRIEVGGRLVEDHERRVAQERARERDSPPLADGEDASAVADQRLGRLPGARRTNASAPASSRAAQHARRRSRPGRPGGRCRRRCRETASAAEAPRRAARATPPDRTRRDRSHRRATRPAVGSARREEQRGDRALALAARTDECDRLPGCELEIDVVEHGHVARRVRERDALEPHRTTRAGSVVGAGPEATAGCCVDEVEQPTGDGEPVRAGMELRARDSGEADRTRARARARSAPPRSRCGR